MRTTSTVFIVRVFTFLLRLLRLGHGTTWPGEIALRLDPQLIGNLLRRNPTLKTVVVVGTNGKTTTTKLIQHVLNASGQRAFSNYHGANLLNGVASSLLDHASLTGHIRYEAAILEVDENVLPLLLQQLTPTAIVVLNLFRDQLDRYGEVNVISIRWQAALERLGAATTLIMNGQDAQLTHLGQAISASPVYFFGVANERLLKHTIPHEADSIYCPRCSHKLQFTALAFSHIGDFRCLNCGFSNEQVEDLTAKLKLPLYGLFNRYNFSAVALLMERVFGLSLADIQGAIDSYLPAFGRQEKLRYKGKDVLVQLSKNPVGFNQGIELLDEVPGRKVVLLVLNDRIPDGRDISWIWDVDFEGLVKVADQIVVAGDRAFDLGVRLRHAGGAAIPSDRVHVFTDLAKALTSAAALVKRSETLVVFPVYTAMLELRTIMVGDAFN